MFHSGFIFLSTSDKEQCPIYKKNPPIEPQYAKRRYQAPTGTTLPV
jgi:hypothetical protein